ncbi:Zn(2)-C6 fungal-type DNA-binding domain protein [Cordyceps fumosorosea ARSEF 2679]|uniref:Zn(2)-C6 fungal-type DNA-binding domain protein n=1 Tax=Cordyceps fumosorosea (strain ARSEF 2679) TaxID=1081104 RepID=A0A168D978_CORFA|nr:Zn(2)-C6 fungal-type DNA-binding domain protein [Cordyceps fumosorosea ARSEF 2679]OAA72313.1 Zn(2)-C6 fungal-type DNA-binding domain protein [Cordyceps fumosorosea ARSEF 2679]
MAEGLVRKQFVCECGREYIRKEHLQRHKATHGRPSFTCPSCDRSFTRLDLLRRHSKIHGAVVPDSRKEPACDACHASKIKCDGGSRCSLCRKRDIECTYQRANLARRVIDANPDVVFDLSGGNFSANRAPSTTSHRGAPKVTARSVRGTSRTSNSSASDASPPPALMIPISATPLEASWNERTKAGTRVIAHAMGVLRDGGESDALSNPSPKMKLWLDGCFQSYFGQFHETWPILHAPEAEDLLEHVPLAASIAIIGAWRQITDPAAMQMIFAIHQILMQYLFAQLTRFTFDSGQPWPIVLYQASLLNAIFAFEIGRECHTSSTETLPEHFYALDLWKARVMEEVRTSGSSPPTRSIVRYADHPRLAMSALKLDRGIALLYNQSAFIHNEELNMQLTSSYGMWNAHGLHVLYRRIPHELSQRQDYRTSQLMNMTDVNLPFPLLTEDIELVLLGTANHVWTYRRQLGAGATPADLTGQHIHIMLQLELCRHQLNRMYSIQMFPKDHAAELEVLLASYYGHEDDETDPVLLMTEAMRRFCQGTFGAAMLQLLLELHMCADVQQLIDVTSGLYEGNELYTETVLRKQALISEWVVSGEGRAAAIRALTILRLYEEHVARTGNANSRCLDPIVHISLLAAAVVARAWAEGVAHGCICGAALPTLELGGMPGLPDDGPAFAPWIATGGRLQYNGVALCGCNLLQWRERFTRGLPEGGWRQRMDRNWPIM